MGNNKLLKEVELTIIEEFKFLLSKNYSLSKNDIIFNNLLGNILKITFTSILLRREISITYVLEDKIKEINSVLSIAIIKIPYLDVSDYIDLDTYLKKNNLENFHTRLVVNNGTLGGLIVCLKNYIDVLNEHLKDVIEGNDWIEGYCPEWDQN